MRQLTDQNKKKDKDTNPIMCGQDYQMQNRHERTH